MMTTIKRTVFLLMAALILSSPALYAASPEAGSGKGKAWMEKRDVKRQQFYKGLQLTDEQTKLLDANKNKNKEKMKALFQNMHDKRAMLRQELQNSALNMDKINALQSDLKTLQAQMLDDRLQSILEVRKILTPDQFKKFTSQMEERGHMEHFKGKRESSGDGL